MGAGDAHLCALCAFDERNHDRRKWGKVVSASGELGEIFPVGYLCEVMRISRFFSKGGNMELGFAVL